MLQQCSAVPPLRATYELAAVGDQLSLAGCLETRTNAGHGRSFTWSGDPRDDTQSRETVEENPIDSGVRRSQRLVVVEGSRHAVGHFAVVQNRAAAGGSPHDVEAGSLNSLDVVDAGRRLMSAE